MKLLIGILFASCVSVAWADWPKLPFPRGAKVEGVGENVRLNGVPMRMYRVLSQDSTEVVLDFYRTALGEEYKEVQIRRKLATGDYFYTKILSQLKDEYLTTVRVNRVGPELTEALVAISDGRAPESTRELPLGFNLPPETEALSDMESVDAGKYSRQLVFRNAHSIQVNEYFLIDMLQAKGYHSQPKLRRATENSVSLMFVGDAREAMVTLNNIKGGTSVVMTTVNSQKFSERWPD